MIATPTPQLLKEQVISLPEAAKLVPGGGVSKDQVYDWRLKGVRLEDGSRVYLECLRIGNRYKTSVEALERFIAACSQQPGVVAPAQAARAGAMSAERQELVALGYPPPAPPAAETAAPAASSRPSSRRKAR